MRQFVGHPVIERASARWAVRRLRARLGIAPDTPLLAVLPGSRTNEMRFFMPPFREAVATHCRRDSRSCRRAADRAPCCAPCACRADLADADAHYRERRRQIRCVRCGRCGACGIGHGDDGIRAVAHADGRRLRAGLADLCARQPLFSVQYFTLVNVLLDRKAIPEFLQKRLHIRESGARNRAASLRIRRASQDRAIWTRRREAGARAAKSRAFARPGRFSISYERAASPLATGT